VIEKYIFFIDIGGLSAVSSSPKEYIQIENYTGPVSSLQKKKESIKGFLITLFLILV